MAQSGDEGLGAPVAEGRLHLEPLAPTGATSEPGHLGGRAGFVDKHQPLRALLHPWLAVRRPYPTPAHDVSAIGFARQQRFFDGKALPDQQSRQRSGMRFHPALSQEPRRQFRHGDVAISLNPAHKRLNMGRKQTASRRAALPGRGQQSRLRLALGQANRCRRTHPKPPCGRPARLALFDLTNNPSPKIN